MARKAGSIVINRLRDRILLGRYFGRWTPGDRLPSVREVARLEDVDRKTAAAAYRRLEREGLVHVEPRSGVYLETERRSDGTDPLRRLHQQWLEHTLASATQLGLDSGSVARMIHAVAAVQQRRVPLLDEDPAQAALLAGEVRARTGLDCVPTRPGALPARSGPLKDPPFVLATPAAARELHAIVGRIPIVYTTLNPSLLDEISRKARKGPVAVVVGTRALAEEIRRAMDHGMTPHAARIRVLWPSTPADVREAVESDAQVVVWPGAPEWANAAADGASRPSQLLADSTFDEIRRQVARAALIAISRSSATVSR